NLQASGLAVEGWRARAGDPISRPLFADGSRGAEATARGRGADSCGGEADLVSLLAHASSVACMTVTAWPPTMMRSPCSRTRTTPPRAEAWKPIISAFLSLAPQ